MHGFSSNLSSEIDGFYHNTRPQLEHTYEQDKLIGYVRECVAYLQEQCIERLKWGGEKDDFLTNMRCNQTSDGAWNVFKFGSAAWGTAAFDSDIDLSIRLNFDADRNDTLFILTELSQIISENDHNGNLRVQLMLSASYPIIRVHHLQWYNLRLDISVADVFCSKRNRFMLDAIGYYQEEFGLPMHQLIVFLKHWSKQRYINSAYRCYLSSFGFTLLFIHFVKHLIVKNKHIKRFSKACAAQYMFDFFQFYCFEFDLTKYKVCIAQTANGDAASSAVVAPPLVAQTTSSCVLEIMDPVNPHNNVAASVGIAQFEHIKYEFLRCFVILREYMINNHKNDNHDHDQNHDNVDLTSQNSQNTLNSANAKKKGSLFHFLCHVQVQDDSSVLTAQSDSHSITSNMSSVSNSSPLQHLHLRTASSASSSSSPASASQASSAPSPSVPASAAESLPSTPCSTSKDTQHEGHPVQTTV